MSTVGLAIPSIPPRGVLLARAMASVGRQELPPDAVAVAVDRRREGAPATRTRAAKMLGDVDWVCLMDDDDELYPQHIRRLVEAAEAEDADLVYPWFDVAGGTDPFPENFGRPWDPAAPVQTTVTCIWRREALEGVGWFDRGFDPGRVGVDAWGNRAGEEHEAAKRLNAAGGRIGHLPERTWLWHHDSGNTSGRPDRW
jgi:glycosyltransferase involved in cell wall biosynthesis